MSNKIQRIIVYLHVLSIRNRREFLFFFLFMSWWTLRTHAGTCPYVHFSVDHMNVCSPRWLTGLSHSDALSIPDSSLWVHFDIEQVWMCVCQVHKEGKNATCYLPILLKHIQYSSEWKLIILLWRLNLLQRISALHKFKQNSNRCDSDRYMNYKIHCPAKKKSHHLDLTKQIGTSLLLDNYCMGDYISAGNKLFNPNWCSE